MVVAEHNIGAKSGKIIEKVGSHHPKTKETIFDGERIKYWISVGAKASDRVHNMLISEGIIEGKKINVLPKKTPIVKAKADEVSSPDASDEVSREEKTEEVAPAEGEEAAAEEVPAEEGGEKPAEESTEEKPADPIRTDDSKKSTSNGAREESEAPLEAVSPKADEGSNGEKKEE